MKKSNSEKNNFLQNIAYLGPGWPKGYVASGISTYIHNICYGLKKLGINTFILTGNIKKGYKNKNIINLNKKILKDRSEYLNDKEIINSIEFRNIYIAILKSLKKLKEESKLNLFEIEETFGLAGIISKRSPVPVVVRLHGPHFLVGASDSIKKNDEFYQRVKNELLGIKAAVAVSAPSKHVLEKTFSYYKIKPKISKVISNPIKCISKNNRWSIEKCNKKNILFVGRFDRCKGGDIIIDSFKEVLKTFPNHKLIFVGPDRGLIDNKNKKWFINSYIKFKVRDKEKRKKIKYLGYQPPNIINDLRKDSFITIVPSRYETFPGTVLEAMSFGCPIIASRTGGIPEQIQNKRNGLLFRKGDSNDLAENIMKLIDNHSLAERLGKQAWTDCKKRYDPEIIARKTLDFYKKVID